ncbi:hypothetical protein ABZ714_22915 [Streptomyces sp. NPDC006798]|uniref:hypothetical protein n=1 Tax=Streptomyces sp. NPDC006798 TaxID=3155462 RepID=UPI0033F5C49D
MAALRPEPTASTGAQPVAPLTDATRMLPSVGYTIVPTTWADPARLTGWTQVAHTCWSLLPPHRIPGTLTGPDTFDGQKNTLNVWSPDAANRPVGGPATPA